MLRLLTVAAACILAAPVFAQPLTTAFTFQGRLDTGGSPASGAYDLRFALFDAATGGTQLGSQLCVDNVSVTNGLVTVQLDFGSQFAGSQRFLEVQARQDTGLTCGSGTGFTTLTPRQNLSAAPNADFSLAAASALTAGTATNATQLNGQPASFYTNAANLTGTLPSASLVGPYSSALNLSSPSNIFVGNGAGLTQLNAGNLATGTLSDFRLSANVAFLSGAQTFSGAKSFSAATDFNNSVNYNFSGRTLIIRNDSGLVPGLDLTGSSGNVGILRVRNKIEMWPNDAGTTPAGIDVRDSAGAAQINLDGGTGNGQFNGDLIADNAGRNTGGVANSLRFGTPSSGELIASKRNGGGNQNGLDLFTAGVSRLSITNAGNVGIGTTAPAARLDVNGTIRSTGGVVFPDGSTQYRADPTLDRPLITSGLPAGSTFTVTLNGTTATLASPIMFDHPASETGGSWNFTSGIRATTSFHVRRPRTADQQWVNWTISTTSLALAMNLTVPGGANASWSATVSIGSHKLTMVNGVLMEDMDLNFQPPFPLGRSSSGSPSVSPPSTEEPTISVTLNNAALPNVVAYADTAGQVVGIDPATGMPLGARGGPLFAIRTNPFSSQVPRLSFVNGTSQSGAILTSGTTYRSSPHALVTRYTIRLADDGLPIEEFTVALDPS